MCCQIVAIALSSLEEVEQRTTVVSSGCAATIGVA